MAAPRKWLRFALIAIAVLALVVGSLYEASPHVVRGWLRGDAFYDGRPTSYWGVVLMNWRKAEDGPEHLAFGFEHDESWLLLKMRKWGFAAPIPDFLELLHGPKILNDNDANLVLRELLHDPSPNIRQLARFGLGIRIE